MTYLRACDVGKEDDDVNGNQKNNVRKRSFDQEKGQDGMEGQKLLEDDINRVGFYVCPVYGFVIRNEMMHYTTRSVL